jgi:hypothetical protein
MAPDAHRHAEALNAFWDDVALGRAPISSHDVDGETVNLVERLHAFGEAPESDSARERVYRHLQQHRRWKEPDVDSRAFSVNGVIALPPVRRPREWARSHPVLPPTRQLQPTRWAPAQLATALLVLLVLLGSLFTFGAGRPVQQEDAPAFLPSISGTPATPEIVTEVLFDASVAGLPTGFGEAAVVRWTLDPGSRALPFVPLEGPRFFIMESGEATVTESGTEHRLVAGDIYLPAIDQEATFLASGAEAAVFLRGFVAKQLVSANDVADLNAHRGVFLIDVFPGGLPGGSGQLRLDRLTLPPGSALPPYEVGQFDWAEAVAGTLGLTLEGPELPPAWTTGEEQVLRGAGGHWFPESEIAAGTRVTVRNAGDDPLILYHLTLTPETAGAAHVGTPVP